MIRKPVSSAGKLFGINTVDGEDGTPYLTRTWIGRLRLHIFHRPDMDPDPHDHPWDFTTFPIWPPKGYVEEVVETRLVKMVQGQPENHAQTSGRSSFKKLQIVPAFRISRRPATHCHRVMGAWSGRHVGPIGSYDPGPHGNTHDPIDGYYPGTVPGKIVTLVWRSAEKRKWGFLKSRDGRWCWVAWKDYVFAGGKDGPCQ